MPSPSSGGSTTTVQKSDPWSGQQPYLKYGFQQAQDLYQTGGPQYYGASTVAPLSPVTNAAMQGQARYAMNGGNPLVGASTNALMNTVNGDYLNSNPYLDANFNAGADAITRSYGDAVRGNTASFEQGGRTGSGMENFYQNQANDTLAKNLNELEGQTFYQNYNDERQNQLNATRLAPEMQAADYQNYNALGDVGSALDQNAQNLVNADVNRWNYNANLPNTNLANFMNMIQGNYGGQSTSTGSYNAPSNTFGNILSAGLTGAGMLSALNPVVDSSGLWLGSMFFSDRRLKTNVKPTGAKHHGLTVYTYNYIGDDTPRTGLMADEVAAVAPDAVALHPSGYLMVNYAHPALQGA